MLLRVRGEPARRAPASGVVAPLTPTRYRVQACGEIATYVCQDATHPDPVCTFETIADVVVPRSAVRARRHDDPPPTLQEQYRAGALVPPGSYNPRTGEISKSYVTGQYSPTQP